MSSAERPCASTPSTAARLARSARTTRARLAAIAASSTGSGSSSSSSSSPRAVLVSEVLSAVEVLQQGLRALVLAAAQCCQQLLMGDCCHESLDAVRLTARENIQPTKKKGSVSQNRRNHSVAFATLSNSRYLLPRRRLAYPRSPGCQPAACPRLGIRGRLAPWAVIDVPFKDPLAHILGHLPTHRLRCPLCAACCHLAAACHPLLPIHLERLCKALRVTHTAGQHGRIFHREVCRLPVVWARPVGCITHKHHAAVAAAQGRTHGNRLLRPLEQDAGRVRCADEIGHEVHLVALG
eukprot:scaffold51202_cov65-Phaeocystis_antarctica.AAC.6